MNKLIYIISFCFIFLSSCDAQNKQEKLDDKFKNEIDALSQEPKIDIIVNKKFDELGNQIAFDSTYTLYYSNIKGDTTLKEGLYNQYNPFLKGQYSNIFDEQYESLFLNDSLMYDNFFNSDYYIKGFEMHDTYFKKIIEEIDSLKKNFFLKQIEI